MRSRCTWTLVPDQDIDVTPDDPNDPNDMDTTPDTLDYTVTRIDGGGDDGWCCSWRTWCSPASGDSPITS